MTPEQHEYYLSTSPVPGTYILSAMYTGTTDDKEAVYVYRLNNGETVTRTVPNDPASADYEGGDPVDDTASTLQHVASLNELLGPGT